MIILEAALLGLVVGISGTLLGGLLIYYSGSNLPQQSCLLGLSGGIMTAVVLFDLWPEAVHYGSLLTTTVGTLLGFGLIVYFEAVMKLVPWFGRRNYSRIVKLGLLLGVGIGSHTRAEPARRSTSHGWRERG